MDVLYCGCTEKGAVWMKELYIDIMDLALSAYDDGRIRAFLQEVERDGLTEQGFPRLASNIGILIAHGRREGLREIFCRMMDICCSQMPKKKARNDFSVREVCCCLLLLRERKVFPREQLERWKNQLEEFDPWQGYNVIAPTPQTPVGNWAAFGAVSEYVRGILCGQDTRRFVDWQVSSQLLSFDENGMYKDPGNPILYDLMTRALLSVLLELGYEGGEAERLRELLDRSTELTLKLQSVTGEIPFGGRSNQFVFNEPVLCACLETAAARLARAGEWERAAQCRGAARLAAENTLLWLKRSCLTHTKSGYDPDGMIGCEDYGYFNKYMITTASNAYLAYLAADESVPVGKTPAETGGYLIQTGPDFHKTVLCAGDYFAEYDTAADDHYDAGGLGRIHRRGCPSSLCLSVPFPAHAAYLTEGKNKSPMSLCCWTGEELGAAGRFDLLESKAEPDRVSGVFQCVLPSGRTVEERCEVSADGVVLTLRGHDGGGFCIPVLQFDGAHASETAVEENRIEVRYGGGVCVFRFDGELLPEQQDYFNRNGRYRVYRTRGSRLEVNMKQERK